MEQKTCITCKQTKDISDFEKRSDTNNYRNQCKSCRLEYVNKYRRERTSGDRTIKEIQVINNTKQCAKCKETKDLSEFPIRTDTTHGYRHECKACKSAELSKYNTQVYNEIRRQRRYTDIEYRLKCNHRNYIYKCLTKFTKHDSSLSYLGCTLGLLKEWLEFQFSNDMTWSNYGKYWTVDHIIPLDMFDLEDEKQQSIAFNWKNMQPSTDNFVKNNKLRLYEYFNAFISAHRYIQSRSLDKKEYQGLNESLNWLREKLRYGNNLVDSKAAVTNSMAALQIDNPHLTASS